MTTSINGSPEGRDERRGLSAGSYGLCTYINVLQMPGESRQTELSANAYLSRVASGS
jgi:hypothetical protein